MSLTDRHIAQLWGRMVRIYGHRWTSSFGDADDGTWLTGLADLSPDMLADGLRACIRDRNDGWPPSLPEFRCLCLRLPGLDEAVQAALVGRTDDPVTQHMLATLPSWDRQHMTRRELTSHYRAVYDSCLRFAAEEVIGPERQVTHEPA